MLPKPRAYKPTEGAAIYELGNVPNGWEYRFEAGGMWHEMNDERPRAVDALVEARKKPVPTVDVRVPMWLAERWRDNSWGVPSPDGDGFDVGAAAEKALKESAW